MKLKSFVILAAAVMVIAALAGALVYFSAELSNKRAKEALELAKSLQESGETGKTLQQLQLIRDKYPHAEAHEESSFLFGEILQQEGELTEAEKD